MERGWHRVQNSSWESKTIWFASAYVSIQATCSNSERRRDLTDIVQLWTSSVLTELCHTEQAPLFSCVVDIISTDRVVPLNKHHCSSRSFDISQCCHAAYTMLCNSVKLGLWSSNSGLILRSGPALKINSHVDCFFKNIQIVYYFKKKLK